ncbi:MAG TPA: WYL domain-containing protein [Bacteroidales bacterium]|nr:WYL domain-containing protein [Bacteroidales bacterium]HQB20766.1 WYL domain-containing protein [Bacteroidales bacterium]
MYFWEDLLEECNNALMEYNPDCNGISRRQLFDDIKFMESDQGWAIPLERHKYGKKVYYRYEDPNFSINNQPLNEMEAEKIRSAIQIISRFSGTPQFEWVDEMIPMFESKFGLEHQKNKIIGFEENVDLKGRHFLSALLAAIINERVLLVKYQDFKSMKPYEITFHPYYLKQYNARWFVFGLKANNQTSIWNLALDRIETLSETSQKYIPSDIDWDEYFYDLVGVTLPQNVELQEIVLKFSKDLAPYIITKPIHPSQRHKNEPDGLTVKIKVIPNIELEKLILSFGNEIEVVSPESLRQRISVILKQASEKYL